MAWCGIADKLISKPMLTSTADILINHFASVVRGSHTAQTMHGHLLRTIYGNSFLNIFDKEFFGKHFFFSQTLKSRVSIDQNDKKYNLPELLTE